MSLHSSWLLLLAVNSMAKNWNERTAGLNTWGVPTAYPG